MNFSDVLPISKKINMFEDMANGLIDRFGFKYPDQIDIEEICSYYKIKIKSSGFSDLTFAVCTGIRKGIIYVQKPVTYLKYKELIGEEFSHLYLHTISQLQTTKHLLAHQERQAKNFSAFLYMPLKMLKEVAISYDQPVDITSLADEFVLSEEFVYYRLSLLFPGKVDAIARSKNSFGYIRWLDDK